jgi:hypothetical protein
VALSTEDVDAAVAQWQEWTTDDEFSLLIEVKVDDVSAKLGTGGLVAHVQSESRYLQVQIYRGGAVFFSERCPYDAEALKASIAVLARTIAAHQGDG